MFTGIIEELGVVERAGTRLEIRAREVLSDLAPGASIAVNGVCLTAVRIPVAAFSADVSPETLARSSLGALRSGDEVNLERPLSPSGRLGGHLVQGHVDGTGSFLELEPAGDGNWWLKVAIPEDLERYVVEKGSIAIDGISLTVAAIADGVMSAAIIPHTYASTNLKSRRSGERVNIECDVLAKYVEKLLGAAPKERPRLTMDKLRELGY